MMNKITMRDLREIKQNRLFRFRKSVSVFDLLNHPLEKTIERVRSSFFSELATALSNDSDLKKQVVIRETADMQRETKVFTADVVILTGEEFSRLMHDYEMLELRVRGMR